MYMHCLAREQGSWCIEDHRGEIDQLFQLLDGEDFIFEKRACLKRGVTVGGLVQSVKQLANDYLKVGKISQPPCCHDAQTSLIFGSSEGKPLDPAVLSHEFHRIVKRAGLENVHFHDLRHTFASLMLLRGAKPKVLSEALGHASVAFTMDTYSHIISGMQEDTMALLDEVLSVGVSQKINANLTPTLPKRGGITKL